jgi:hypothetical protein
MRSGVFKEQLDDRGAIVSRSRGENLPAAAAGRPWRARAVPSFNTIPAHDGRGDYR